jgi:hypothetical protein
VQTRLLVFSPLRTAMTHHRRSSSRIGDHHIQKFDRIAGHTCLTPNKAIGLLTERKKRIYNSHQARSDCKATHTPVARQPSFSGQIIRPSLLYLSCKLLKRRSKDILRSGSTEGRTCSPPDKCLPDRIALMSTTDALCLLQDSPLNWSRQSAHEQLNSVNVGMLRARQYVQSARRTH